MKKLPKSKKLDGAMMPFTEVFYKDCFYSSLFSVLRYFQRDIMGFLLNDLILYRPSPEKWLQTDVEYVPGRSVKELLADLQVDCFEGRECRDIVESIRQALNENMPIIVKVDCFYEPIRKDLYGIEHLDHNLLVYGYDDGEEIFSIFEHNNRNSLRYKPETISYEGMRQASQGYRKHFGHLNEPEHMKFWTSGHPAEKSIHGQEYYLAGYFSRYLENRSEAVKSLEQLLKLKDCLARTLVGQELLTQYTDEILDALTTVITAKKMEQYRAACFFKNEELLRTIKAVVNDWTFVRLAIFNYKYDGENIEEKLKSAVDMLDRLCGQEERLVCLMNGIAESFGTKAK